MEDEKETEIVVDKDLIWKRFDQTVDLYKHYLDLLVKFNAYYYATTGAILSFYFSRVDIASVRYSLLFPAIMSIAFGILFIYGAYKIRFSSRDILAMRDKLGLSSAPEFNILTFFLFISAILMFVVAAALIWVFRGAVK